MTAQALKSRLDRGLHLQRQGLTAEAIACYRDVSHDAALPPAEVALGAEALLREAGAHRVLCDWDAALDAARRGERLAAAAGLRDLAAEALNARALVHHSRGEMETAEALYRQVLAATDDPRIQGLALQNLGSAAAERRDFDEAEHLLLGSYERFVEAGYDRGQAIAANNYARVVLDNGEPEAARLMATSALEAARRVDDVELIGIASMNVAATLVACREYAEAERHASEAYGRFTSGRSEWRRVEALRVLGDIRRALGDDAEADHCYRRAIDLARRIHTPAEVERIERLLGG